MPLPCHHHNTVLVFKIEKIGAKTIPDGAANTYMAYIREYPHHPPPPQTPPGGGGGGVLPGILGGGVPPGSQNPDLISDQEM